MAQLDVATLAALVSAAVQGAATGGAPRQGLAAAVSAALRTGVALLVPHSSGPTLDPMDALRTDSEEQGAELAARVAAITPVLANQVTGRPTSGAQRLRRNVAAHVGFGEGAALVRAAPSVLRCRQRGGRCVPDPAVGMPNADLLRGWLRGRPGHPG